MELCVAMACMAILGAAACMSFSVYISLIKKSKAEAHLLRRSQSLLEYIVNETRRVGGQGAPALASVFIENDCGVRGGFPDCDHTDRLTLAEPLAGYGTCKVKADLGARTIDVNKVRVALGTPQVCCFSAVGSLAQFNPTCRSVPEAVWFTRWAPTCLANCNACHCDFTTADKLAT